MHYPVVFYPPAIEHSINNLEMDFTEEETLDLDRTSINIRPKLDLVHPIVLMTIGFLIQAIFCTFSWVPWWFTLLNLAINLWLFLVYQKFWQNYHRRLRQVYQQSLDANWRDWVGYLGLGKAMLPKYLSKSESYFYEWLKPYFSTQLRGGNIYQSGQLLFDSSLELLFPNGLGAIVIIEVPYNLDTNEIYTAADRLRRDAFFTETGWVVVRFSEHQALLDPDGCRAFLSQVVANLMGHSYHPYPEKVVGDNIWTDEDAKEMARCEYRQTYLNSFNI
jgi:hypothetical protein